MKSAGADRPRPPREIRRCRAHHERLHAEEPGGEIRAVARFADAHGKIEAVFEQIDHAIAERDLHVEARMPAGEPGEHRRHAPAAFVERLAILGEALP